jgi:hypothetical protein
MPIFLTERSLQTEACVVNTCINMRKIIKRITIKLQMPHLEDLGKKQMLNYVFSMELNNSASHFLFANQNI